MNFSREERHPTRDFFSNCCCKLLEVFPDISNPKSRYLNWENKEYGWKGNAPCKTSPRGSHWNENAWQEWIVPWILENSLAGANEVDIRRSPGKYVSTLQLILRAFWQLSSKKPLLYITQTAASGSCSNVMMKLYAVIEQDERATLRDRKFKAKEASVSLLKFDNPFFKDLFQKTLPVDGFVAVVDQIIDGTVKVRTDN